MFQDSTKRFRMMFSSNGESSADIECRACCRVLSKNINFQFINSGSQKVTCTLNYITKSPSLSWDQVLLCIYSDPYPRGSGVGGRGSGDSDQVVSNVPKVSE